MRGRRLLPAVAIPMLAALVSPGAAHAWYDANYNLPYAYELATTRLTGLDNCDDCEQVVNLPFSFPFYGQTYNQIVVSTNGWVAMGGTSPGHYYNNAELKFAGTASAPNAFIAPLWDDWDTHNG